MFYVTERNKVCIVLYCMAQPICCKRIAWLNLHDVKVLHGSTDLCCLHTVTVKKCARLNQSMLSTCCNGIFHRAWLIYQFDISNLKNDI